MDKLEQLKKEMLEAIETRGTFWKNNSRELTEEEKKMNPPLFTGIVDDNTSEPKVFVLTTENLDEFKQVDKNLRETQSAYAEEYLKSTQNEHPAFELNFCDKCFQMTNHLLGICQKCINR